MGMVIGIDIGGSTTKIIGIENNTLKEPLLVKATDPIASLFGAFGKFIDNNSLSLTDIEQIMITGVGSSFLNKPIYGIPTGKVEEFLANGLGGLYNSKLKKALIVSMGTGTSFVKASSDCIKHIGGTGIGGGTIQGLSSRMLNLRDITSIIAAAENGDIKNIDLMVGDIAKSDLPGLPGDITASNFGKLSDIASQEDIALGILNMVFQTIGMMSIFILKNTEIKDVVLIGNLSKIPQCSKIFKTLEDLFPINFIIPKNSEYSTALGSALAYEEKKEFILLK